MARQGREFQRYDVDGSRLVAGVVPLLPDGNVVLICNRKNREKWGLPKGGWETDESVHSAASREAFEEAGVQGTIGTTLKVAEAKSKSGQCQRINWFVYHVTALSDDWPERSERNRIVVPIEEALQMVHRPEHRAAILEVKGLNLPFRPSRNQTFTKFLLIGLVALAAVTLLKAK